METADMFKPSLYQNLLTLRSSHVQAALHMLRSLSCSTASAVFPETDPVYCSSSPAGYLNLPSSCQSSFPTLHNFNSTTNSGFQRSLSTVGVGCPQYTAEGTQSSCISETSDSNEASQELPRCENTVVKGRHQKQDLWKREEELNQIFLEEDSEVKLRLEEARQIRLGKQASKNRRGARRSTKKRRGREEEGGSGGAPSGGEPEASAAAPSPPPPLAPEGAVAEQRASGVAQAAASAAPVAGPEQEGAAPRESEAPAEGGEGEEAAAAMDRFWRGLGVGNPRARRALAGLASTHHHLRSPEGAEERLARLKVVLPRRTDLPRLLEQLPRLAAARPDRVQRNVNYATSLLHSKDAAEVLRKAPAVAVLPLESMMRNVQELSTSLPSLDTLELLGREPRLLVIGANRLRGSMQALQEALESANAPQPDLPEATEGPNLDNAVREAVHSFPELLATHAPTLTSRWAALQHAGTVRARWRRELRESSPRAIGFYLTQGRASLDRVEYLIHMAAGHDMSLGLVLLMDSSSFAARHPSFELWRKARRRNAARSPVRSASAFSSDRAEAEPSRALPQATNANPLLVNGYAPHAEPPAV